MDDGDLTITFTTRQIAALFLLLGLVIGGAGMYAAVPQDVTEPDQSKTVPSGTGDTDTSDQDRISLEGVDLAGEPSLGNESAPVKVIEVTEFGCPFCAEWEGFDASARIPIDQMDVKEGLVESYVETGEVQFIQKNWPQPRLHPNSLKGHRIANCVYENAGTADYWKYQGQLFDRRDQWMQNGQDAPNSTFRQITNDLGLDSSTIMSCYADSDGTEARTDKAQLTEAAGRLGTPTFFIGNSDPGYIKITGAQPLSRFEQAIRTIRSEAQ